MLTENFEILLAQTCTEKEFGKIDVTPSHCVITTHQKDRLTGEFTEHRERFVYGTSPTIDLIILNLCDMHFSVEHMTELYLHRDEFAEHRVKQAKTLTNAIKEYREAAL
jgi:hypothetical protein